MDEMQGFALSVPVDGFDTSLTTDEFSLPQFVNQRIELMPLRPLIPPDAVSDLRLKLDVTNRGATDLSVYAGDLQIVSGALSAPLFNPTFELASIQPGRRIVINGIHIRAGYGRDHAMFNVARRGAYTHLDLEQHTDDEIRKRPEDGGTSADLSGYKLSCLVANPRQHRLRFVVPATSRANYRAEALSVLTGACANLEDRLRLVISTVERRAEADTVEGNSTHRGLQYTVTRLGDGLFEARLLIPGETTTIGEVICRTIHDLTPDIAYAVSCPISYENRLSVTVRHRDDVTPLLLAALQFALTTFSAIRRGAA